MSGKNIGENPMRLTNTLRQWLKDQEWNEQPEINEEKQTSSTGFNYKVAEFDLRCFFEINEKTEICKLYMYYFDTKAPESRIEAVQKFILGSNESISIGNLQLTRNERSIRFYAAIDVEGASFEPAHITNLINAGIGALKRVLPKFMAICFGGKTAEEMLEDE
jgi:hypothetical protein